MRSSLMAAGKAKSSDQIKSEPFDGCYPCFGGNGIRGYVDEYNQEGTFSIVGRQGALCGNINIASGKFYATEHAVVTTLFNGIDFNWSNYTLEAFQSVKLRLWSFWSDTLGIIIHIAHVHISVFQLIFRSQN